MIVPTDSADSAARRRFAWWLTAAFVLVTAPRLLAHELWRDEAWQWLVAVESRSLGELFSGMSRGGGSGYVFPLLCYLVRQVSTSPLAMQFLHLAVAAAAAFAFVRWAPLGSRERLLFVFGYFPFYEYAVISRSYSTTALFAWLACAAALRRRSVLALGALLGLLCQTTVYGYIMAIAIACGWLLDRWLDRRKRAPLPWAEVWGGLALAIAGAGAALVQLSQAPGTRVPLWRFGWDPAAAIRVLGIPWRALAPVPLPKLTFWNTNVLEAWPVAQAVAGVLMLALAMAVLWRSKVALATFGIGVAGLFVFSYAYFAGVVRHQGHLWLLFAVALWLGGGVGLLGDRKSWRARALLVLLLVHCGVAAFASWMDWRHPFSNGAATAELLRSSGLARQTLLGHREPPAATVAMYLGQPLYSPSRKIFVMQPDWSPMQRELKEPELRCAARELATREGRDIVLVINRELPQWAELDAAGSRRGAIVATEDYHLYWLRHRRLAASARQAACPP